MQSLVLIVRFYACECLLMNVVREIDVSSNSDNTDSRNIDFHDSSDVCSQSLSLSSSCPVDSCNLLQTDLREEPEN